MFRSLHVLRVRNYALMWWSGLISNAGTWMQVVAVGALVTDLTDSAGWGGLVAGASFLSAGIVTPFGGVVADHHNRVRLIQLSSVALALISIVQAVAYHQGWVTPEFLLVTVIMEGALTGVIIPANGATMPDVVGSENVADAAALNNASWNLGRTIGPALAGVTIVYGSYTMVFALNAVTFIGVAAALAFVRLPGFDVRSNGSLLQRLREGWVGARADTGCWTAIRITAITAVLVSPFIALMPAVAQIVFDGSAVDTAHFVMAQGLGSVVGAFLFAGAVRRFGRHRVMIALLVMLPLSEMLYAVAPTKNTAIACAFLLGAGYIAITVGMTVIVQLRSPIHLRARVLALNFMTLSLFYPVGATVQGHLGDLFGIREVLFVSPVLYLTVLAILAVRFPALLRSLDGPPSSARPEAKSAEGLRSWS